ncbi:MAG: hypothetical protein RL693_1848 [Verrucomicrobiota bacterium]
MITRSPSRFKSGIVAIVASLLLIGATRAVELATLPGVTLQKVTLGMNETEFNALYPTARKGATSATGQQYWMMQQTLHLLDFRTGKLALVTASYGGIGSDEQRRRTSAIAQEYATRFGPPEVVKTAKLLSKGVAETSALIYDLKAYSTNAKAIVESSELELAVTIFDTSLRGSDRLFFPVGVLLAELNRNAPQPKKALEPGTFIDYVGEIALRLDTTKPISSAPKNDESTNEVGSREKKGHPFENEATKNLPTAGTERSWLVWLLLVIAATVGAVWVFLRKSK